MTIQDYLKQSASAIEDMATYTSLPQVERTIDAIVTALRARRALLVCGNGGSASDAAHIAGEIVGRFLKERPAYKCYSLADNAAVMTAWSNDYSFETVFARQVEAYGETGGILWGISTSGNSKNVLAAMEQAKKMGLITISMTGQGGGKMAALSDILLDVPSKFTPIIQQIHLCLYHYICEQVEARLVANP